MEAITQYRSLDGAIFSDPGMARERDLEVIQVNQAMGLLPTLSPTQSDLLRGGKAYYQHDPVDVVAARRSYFEVAKRFMPVWYAEKPAMFDPALAPSRSIFGRIVDDGPDRPLKWAWSRFTCIDDKGREWEQPYYASNTPDDAISLN